MDRLGKYSILGELGRGAMGIVYLGEDPYIGRKVALKTIRFDSFTQPSDQEMAQERFMREARSAGNLSHPHIVTIYEVGEDNGVTFIAMEYIEGQSLEDLIVSGKRFSLEEITDLVAQIGDALDFAHRRGVIHRDIKPANILIDKEGHPHIVDFGIARFTSSTMTLTRAIIGTPYYMSPEQIAGNNIDHRTDIFSLGTILYELLTGNKPFPGDSITTVMYKIVHEAPPPACTPQRKLPRHIDMILSKALAKRPQDRFKSCAELTDALCGLKDYPEIPEPIRAPAGETIRPPVSPFGKKETRWQTLDDSASFEPSKEKSSKPLLFLLLAMMAIVVLVTISVYVYFTGNRPAGSQGGGGPASVSTRPSAETYLQAGKDRLERGEYEEALAEFRGALRLNSQNFEAQLGVADALRELGRPDEAAQEYEKANALNDTDSRPYLRLGEIHDRFGDKDKALEFYKRFLDLAPAYIDTGRVSRRIEEIRRSFEAEVKPEEEEKEEVPFRVQPEEKTKPEESQKSGETSGKVSPEPKTEEIKPQDQPAVEKKEEESKDEEKKKEQPDVDLNQMFSLGMRALRQKDYQLCIVQMETILKHDPSHSQAQYYLALARKSMEEEEAREIEEQRLAREIEDRLRLVERDFAAGKYRESLEGAKGVLRLDPDNLQALGYINSANMKMAPFQIQAIVDSYIRSIETKDLVSFYQSLCVPSLFQKIRRDTETTLKLYDDFQAMVSNVEIDIRTVEDGRYEARVSFSHILTGISRSKQTREVLFEGTISWTMEKRDDRWRINEIGYSASGK